MTLKKNFPARLAAAGLCAMLCTGALHAQ
ncbi:hypothetical protein ABH942_002986, partial [Flavobacterium sp. 28YEA47A]